MHTHQFWYLSSAALAACLCLGTASCGDGLGDRHDTYSARGDGQQNDDEEPAKLDDDPAGLVGGTGQPPAIDPTKAVQLGRHVQSDGDEAVPMAAEQAEANVPSDDDALAATETAAALARTADVAEANAYRATDPSLMPTGVGSVCTLDRKPGSRSAGWSFERLGPRETNELAVIERCQRNNATEDALEESTTEPTWEMSVLPSGAHQYIIGRVRVAETLALNPRVTDDRSVPSGYTATGCPSYCTRSISLDTYKCSLAAYACARAGGPPAGLACAAAYRGAIEYDKRTCANMGCGPFMHP